MDFAKKYFNGEKGAALVRDDMKAGLNDPR